MFRDLRIWGRKARRKPLNFLIAYLGQTLMWLLTWTCKVRVTGAEQLQETIRGGKCILMLWHNRMAMIPYSLWHNALHEYRYTAVISKSRDGALLESICNRYKQASVLKIAHDGKHHAVRDMVSRLKAGEILMITPDGPRGPRYQVKPGVAMAAAVARANVVPFSWTADKFWQLNSWDHLMLPKPFSTIHVTFGSPVTAHELREGGVELLQKRLLELETSPNCPTYGASSI